MSDVLAFLIVFPIALILLGAIVHAMWGFHAAPWWWWHTPPPWWWHGEKQSREAEQPKPTVVHNYYIVRGNTPTPQPLPPPLVEEVFIEGEFKEVKQTPLLSDGEKEILRLTGGDQHALVRTSRGR